MKGTCDETAGSLLFDRLAELAEEQGFGVAVELRLADETEATHDGTEAEARACGAWKYATAEEVGPICGEGP